MSGRRNTALFLPTPVEPLIDENGQVSVPWRGWFGQIQRRWSRGEGDPPAITDPTKWPVAGSLYSRTDGTAAAGNLLFVVDGVGEWHPLVMADFVVLTGDPQAPTPPSGDSDNSIATTEFVADAIADVLVSPVFTGDPQAPTPPPGDNDTSIATTEFVHTEILSLGGAPLNSPHFTGDPQAPTPSVGDNDTSIATTAFVQAAVASGAGLYVLLTGSNMSGALSTTKLTAPQVFAEEYVLNLSIVWISGTGAPTSSQGRGSLYSRTDGGVGSSLYVCQGGTTWAAVA
jgi:hypothetical protein